MPRFLLPLAALALAGAATTLPAQGASRAPLVAALDSMAAAAVKRGDFPGISVAVVRGSDTLLLRGYGMADLENDVQVRPDGVFEIGSITKQFTSAAVMRLVEQGQIALDEPITTYLPGFPMHGHTVTVRHLLNHTSGIRSYTSLGPRWLTRVREEMPLDTLLALFRDEPPDFAPGDAYRYNNSGYILLGAIIEKVTGTSWERYLTTTLFEPLGLTSTEVCWARPLIPHRAHGYDRAAGGWQNAEYLSMTQPYAAGALCSTTGDLVRWTRALHGGRVVSASSFARMTTPDTLNDGKRIDYGFGLGVGDLGGHREIMHGGGIFGFASFAAHFPQDSLTIVALSNSGSGSPQRLVARMARRVLGVPEPEVARKPLTAEEVARFPGTYAQGEAKVTVLVREGALWLVSPDGSEERFLSQGNGRFLQESDPSYLLTFVPVTARAERVVLTYDGRTVFMGKRE